MRRVIFALLAMLLPLVALADNSAEKPKGDASAAAPAKETEKAK